MEEKGQFEQRGVCREHCVSCSAWKAVEAEVGVGNGFPLLIQERFSRIKGAMP